MANFIYVNANPAPVISAITYLGTGTSFNIGTARPDCLIVTCGFIENDGAAATAPWAIAGVTGTLVYGASLPDRMAMVCRNVTTGGTITVGGLTNNFAWMINGLTNNAIYSSNAAASSGTTITTSVSTPVGVPSCIVNIARSRSSFASNALSASGPVSAPAILSFAFNSGGGGNHAGMGGYVVPNGLGGTITTVDSASVWTTGVGFSATFY